MTIRTILVDDEPLATQGLQLRLQAHEDVEVVGTAANGREAIRQIKTAARGFRNFTSYRRAILFFLGRLDRCPQTFS